MKARTNRLKRNNISDNDDSTLCPEKSKPNTMYHRNVKSECILCKFCVLGSEVLFIYYLLFIICAMI